MSEGPLPNQRRKQGAGVGVAIIIAVLVIWYNNNPRFWLMPNLESGDAMGTVFQALSPDDPSTPEMVEGKTTGEPMSDRNLFIQWAMASALDPSIETPLTVGGAIAVQRRLVEESTARFRADDAARNAAEAVKEADRQHANHEFQQERQAEAAAVAAEQAIRQAEYDVEQQALAEEEQAKEARAAAKDEAIRRCQEPYDQAFKAYGDSPTMDRGAAVSQAGVVKNACLDAVYRKWP